MKKYILTIGIIAILACNAFTLYTVAHKNLEKSPEKKQEKNVRALWESRCKNLSFWLLCGDGTNYKIGMDAEVYARLTEALTPEGESRMINNGMTKKEFVEFIFAVEHPDQSSMILTPSEQKYFEANRTNLARHVASLKTSIIEYHVQKGE